MTHQEMIDRGLARLYRGRLIPVIGGGSQDADPPFPEIPADLQALSDDDLAAFARETEEAIQRVGENPESYVTDALSSDDLLAAMEDSVDALEAAREVLASRETPEEPEGEGGESDPEEPEAELAVDRDRFAALAARASEPEPEPDAEPEPEDAPTEDSVVAAAAVAVPQPRRRPARREAARPSVSREVEHVALVAAGGSDLPDGTEYGSELDVANAMIRRRRQFGNSIPEGASDKVVMARADWADLYPTERKLGMDEERNLELVASVVDPKLIRAEMDRRRNGGPSLVASGGLCAPVTPYYQLQMISVSDRPVRSALPSFNADRGGIRYGRPASIGDVTTAVGVITADDDAAGGTFATKTCQVVDCPDFQETDVDTIYHCIQFGNLGARTFPERVAQWNSLVLAQHARVAESGLLTGIDTASTQVTAGNLGLGATASLLGQILAAANGMRNRNRMDPEAVLRLLIPDWALDLMISDVIRSQFQRFETDEARMTALLRSFDIEPTFYIDGAAGRAQVFGAQTAGALLPFPDEVVWYLFPEGSFLYLDGGTLELGLVRDSVLNQTNDFQIFGETFEEVAFVGVESLAVASTACDSGVVAGTHDTTCPIDYTRGS